MQHEILERVNSPYDVKNLSISELNELSEEVRDIIIQTVSANGGHLASNLGTVELTLALHKVFNFDVDRLIFDVGHQAYTHKIVTGRKNDFSSLRQFGGISGYTDPRESPYDSFIAGHASTALSIAFGFVKARELKGGHYDVVAVVGDGALTGGEAYEGLNNIGSLGKKVLIVLNDNQMSISRNVGAMSRYLSRVRYSNFYQSIRRKTPRTNVGRRIKLAIKELFLQNVLFEELGFTYIGPVDGHNIKELIETFEHTKNINSPTVVHVITKKGKGYDNSEDDPIKFHSSAPFDIETGMFNGQRGTKSFSDFFGEALVEEAKNDNKIVAITAAMPDGTRTDLFKKEFPERFIDVGIAEQCAVSTAAALAQNGFKPVVAIYSTFLQRAYDQLIHDVGILGLPVVFALDRSGIVSDDGPTHQGIFDISFTHVVPSFVVAAPRDGKDLKRILHSALQEGKPFIIRYPKAPANALLDNQKDVIAIGKAELVSEGNDLTIVSVGAMFERALEAREILVSNGISVGLIDARFIKPIDTETILCAAEKSRKVVTIEDNVLIGGFGRELSYFLSEHGISVMNLGIPDLFPVQGKRDKLLDYYGLSSSNIAKLSEDFLRGKKN
ncbi:MAG: 1-deoxy-D-xylulose-5-phosphate synthase [Caldisericaceae bacterium]